MGLLGILQGVVLGTDQCSRQYCQQEEYQDRTLLLLDSLVYLSFSFFSFEEERGSYGADSYLLVRPPNACGSKPGAGSPSTPWLCLKRNPVTQPSLLPSSVLRSKKLKLRARVALEPRAH